MSFDLNADDVFEMAEQMEKNGANFYRTAAENVTDIRIKDMLLKLAAMEVDHEEIFAEMRAALTGSEKTSTVFDPEEETFEYIKALVDTRVFFNVKLVKYSMEEVFKAALQAEKDSIVFYLGMKEIVPNQQGKSRIDSIIKEEMNHIKQIGKELFTLVL